MDCGPAAAQQAAGEADSTAPIVVTAERRPELPEDVPISLTALSGDDLEQMQATDMASLGKVAPSLVMIRTGAFTQPFIRGVGKRSTLGVENGVATYVDGVYLASSIGALLDLRGIERVEILNGPQGTLFGRNTTGGVIQIVTRDPSPVSSAEAELGVGSYGYARGDVYLTGGVGNLAGNLAVSLSRNGGYGTNLYNGKKVQGQSDHSVVVRSKWIWDPAGPFKLALAADYQDAKQDFTQVPVAGYPPIGDPRLLAFREADQDASSRYRFRYGGLSAKAETEVGGLTLLSLSAARWMHALYSVDLDAGPLALLAASPTAYQDQLSQEFQLQSGPSSRLRWVTGLYYIHIDERYDPTNFKYGGSYSAQLGGRTGQELYDTGRVSSYAAYGQATLSLDDRTRLTGGLRYTIEDRSVSAVAQRTFGTPPYIRPVPGLPLPGQEPFRASKSFHNLTWRSSLDRDLSATAMAYLSASRGFQSGGWNLQTPQAPPFLPERVDAFEGGLKYASPNRRYQGDASAFYYNYANLQVSAFTPLGSMTTNATSADIYGLDLQMAAQLDAASSMSFGAQVLEARYNRFASATCTNYSPEAATPYAPVPCDATGNRLPFAPRFKLNLGANRQLALGANGTVLLSANVAYNSGYFSEPDNVVEQTAFTTLDASAEWQPAGGAPSFRLWVLNLTDTHYFDSLVTFPTTGVLQRPAAPRRFGVSIEAHF